MNVNNVPPPVDSAILQEFDNTMGSYLPTIATQTMGQRVELAKEWLDRDMNTVDNKSKADLKAIDGVNESTEDLRTIDIG